MKPTCQTNLGTKSKFEKCGRQAAVAVSGDKQPIFICSQHLISMRDQVEDIKIIEQYN